MWNRDCYFAVHLQEDKIQRKTNYILTCLLMMAPISYNVGLGALLATIIICGSTMPYLLIEQGCIIGQMQKSLFTICLKSIAAQTTDQEKDSGNDSNNQITYQILASLISLQVDLLNHFFA